MVYRSTIKFARFSFEYKISHPDNETEIEKIKREKALFIPVINYELDISGLLKSGYERYKSGKYRKKLKIYKVESMIEEGEWKFGNVIVGDNYIFGKLAKISIKQKPIIDDNIKGFKDTEEKIPFIANFFIDFKHHIFSYEVKNQIGPIIPTLLVRDVFNLYYKNQETISFVPLTDKRKIIERIKKLHQITTVKLSLKRPNPHSSQLSKKFDEYMKNWKAKSTEMTLKSTQGLDLYANDGLLMSGLSLAEEGHGKVTLKNEVEMNGKIIVQEIQSYRYPIFKKVALPKEDAHKVVLFQQKIEEVEESFTDDTGDKPHE